MEDKVQKTNASTENFVVSAENNGAMKHDPSTTELEGLQIRRRYHRPNLTKLISKFHNAIESGEEASAILDAHCAVKLRYESLRAIEDKIQKLLPVEAIEEELASFGTFEDSYASTL